EYVRTLRIGLGRHHAARPVRRLLRAGAVALPPGAQLVANQVAVAQRPAGGQGLGHRFVARQARRAGAPRPARRRRGGGVPALVRGRAVSARARAAVPARLRMAAATGMARATTATLAP